MPSDFLTSEPALAVWLNSQLGFWSWPRSIVHQVAPAIAAAKATNATTQPAIWFELAVSREVAGLAALADLAALVTPKFLQAGGLTLL